MARKSYFLGGLVFTTQKDAVAEVKKIARRNMDMKRLALADYRVIHDLFVNHYHKPFKDEIENIRALSSKKVAHTWCFVVKSGGIEKACSYKMCFGTFTHAHDVKATFRFEIRDQVMETLREHRGYGRGETSVHHASWDEEKLIDSDIEKGGEFIDLVNGFLEKKGVEIEDIKVEDSLPEAGLHFGEMQFVDRFFAHEWRQYHKENAVMKVMRKTDHIEIHRRKERT